MPTISSQILFFFWINFIVFVSWLFFIILALNFIVSLVVELAHFAISLLPKHKNPRVELVGEPFVSIMIPCYNEPSEILKNTLLSISKMDYQNFEVLVIDNNTKDEEIWKPVEEYCKILGQNFRFFHVDQIVGFKAGALNFINKKVNPATQFEVVLDADYEVRKDFLKIALRYFVDDSISFVQFPQSYENVNKKNLPISLEYKYFFLSYMNMANNLNCVSTTGTVTVYRADTIKKAGNYNEKCITEDAEIGLKLNINGHKGIYVNRNIARGLMPYDLEAYKKQKIRWSQGNAQVLRVYFKNLFFDSSEVGIKQKIGFITQLTAWINFLLIPILSLIMLSLIELFGFQLASQSIFHFIFTISSLTIVTYVVLQAASYLVIFNKHSKMRDGLLAFWVHIGMTWVYATAWFKAVFSRRVYFERTNKFILTKEPSILKNTFWELILGTFSTYVFIDKLITGQYLTSVVYLLISFMLLSVFYVNLKITPTKGFSEKLLDKFELEEMS